MAHHGQADRVTIDRDTLRRIAIVDHERMAEGGTFIPVGAHCTICKGEWEWGAKELHVYTCPLY